MFSQAQCERIRQHVDAQPRLTWGDVAAILDVAVELGFVHIASANPSESQR